MVWMCFAALGMCLFVVVLYLGLVDVSKADKEIIEDRVMTPEVTPVPPVETETPELWIRYPVPLDDELQKHIERKCKEYGVPSSIVIAVIGVESSFNPDAVSKDGKDIGLMQIRETVHHDRCVRLDADNLHSPYQNVLVGIDFLAELIDRYDGDWEQALSAYNGDKTGAYGQKVKAYAECLAESVMPFSE